MQVRRYDILDLSEIQKNHPAAPGQERLLCRDVDAPRTVRLPELSLEDQAALPGWPGEADRYEPAQFTVVNPQCYLLRDADLLTKFGAMAVGGAVARESLFHFPWFMYPEFKISGPQYHEHDCTLWAPDEAVTIPAGYCVCAGINENHYHWLILFLSRINSAFVECWSDQLNSRPVLLFPPFRDAVQRESAIVMADHFGLAIHTLADPGAVRVRRLVYPQPMRQGGLHPHPIITETFGILKRKFYKPGAYPEKIYISRKDSSNRKLLNEDEVERVMTQHGYTVVTLAGRTLAEQINLFAHAKVIAGGHGAGLVNIGFAEPGTSVLEIHMPPYFNWCYRRLAACCGLDYEFLAGAPWGDAGAGLHQRQFTLDLNKLKSSLAQGF